MCEIIEPDVRSFVENAVPLDHLLEAVSKGSYEFAGEAAEDWPCGVAWSRDKMRPEERELQDKIINLIVAYLEEHDPPGFWGIGDITEHKVSEGK